jgi:hypothetical protein
VKYNLSTALDGVTNGQDESTGNSSAKVFLQMELPLPIIAPMFGTMRIGDK